MKIDRFLVVAAVLHALLGIAALAAPTFTAATFGIALEPGGGVIVRLLGSTLVGVAAGFWWARSLEAEHVLKGVLVSGFVINLLSFIVVILAVTGGDMGARGWIGAGVRLLLAIGFGYFAFVRPLKAPA